MSCIPCWVLAILVWFPEVSLTSKGKFRSDPLAIAAIERANRSICVSNHADNVVKSLMTNKQIHAVWKKTTNLLKQDVYMKFCSHCTLKCNIYLSIWFHSVLSN